MSSIEYEPHYLKHEVPLGKTLPIDLKKEPHRLVGAFFLAITAVLSALCVRVVVPEVMRLVEFVMDAVQKGAVKYSGDLSLPPVFYVFPLPFITLIIALISLSSSRIHIEKDFVEFSRSSLGLFKKQWRESTSAFAKIEVVKCETKMGQSGTPLVEYRVWLRHKGDSAKNLAVYISPERMPANENARELARLLDRPPEYAMY